MKVIYHTQETIESIYSQYVEQGNHSEHMAISSDCLEGVLIDDAAEQVVRIPLTNTQGYVFNACLYRRSPKETAWQPC
ncbi:hypothetical protein FE236_00985 [Mariprofundus erugo]|uniref:hypothetical protein n=1 Tax=Mariprofundus erugo TaxID=2528639 RepID=UPI0010FEF423|nr:hypothetical protein [Mariprofundus erugo]TLS78358.1 hypothetical protein FE236_00985 [Mariprofundus erugo]